MMMLVIIPVATSHLIHLVKYVGLKFIVSIKVIQKIFESVLCLCKVPAEEPALQSVSHAELPVADFMKLEQDVSH
jgi:hypothetical protein